MLMDKPMKFEYRSGFLFSDDAGLTKIPATDVSVVESSTNETSDNILESISTIDELSFCGTIEHYDEKAIRELFGINTDNDFLFYEEIPVMVMKRWHKNWRIRKKWLKRYGTTLSAIKLLYQIDEPMPEQHKGDTVSISVNVEHIWFSFEPWQLRRGMIVDIGDTNEDKEA